MMEEEKITTFPSEFDEEEVEATADIPEEEAPKYDSALLSDSKSSISSTPFSRTETPDEHSYGLPIDRIKTNHDDDLEKLKQDIVARGIISKPPQKLSEHSTLRGSVMSSVLVSENNPEKNLNQDMPESEEVIKPSKTAVDVDHNLIDSRPSSESTGLSVETPLKVDHSDSEAEQKLSSHSPELVKVGEKETSFISRAGNLIVELSTTCTQTDSSWLKDLEFYEEISRFRPEWIDEMKAIKQRKESKSSSGSTKGTFFKRRKKKSVTEPRSPAPPSAEIRRRPHTGSEEKGEREEREEKEEQEEEEEEQLSREPSFQQSRQSFTSPLLSQSPIREDDMLYRPPTVEMSSESSSEEEYEYIPDESTLIPSIGPPSILQYIKESQHPPMMIEEAEGRDEALGSQNLRRSLFTGPCMFCKKEILPFPTEEEIENADLKSSDLFCCAQYENFIKLELANNKSFIKDELIDIKPHPPFGTKAARKAAKERAAERARQREIDRQKATGASAQNQNFYALARQMKTITYSLASTKCMEEGWTVKPLTPAPTEGGEDIDPFVIEVNPIQQQKRGFLERFYENGQRFLIILPDGTGCCYYPSGNIAVIITSTEKGKFTYLAFADTDDYERTRSNMLAVFDPSGHGTCYFRNSGIVRLVLDPYGGVLLDTYGARKKKWLWHNLKQHVHAPPFQPITFSITKQLSVRCLTQDKIILTFNQGKYTAKFNVGSKLKAVRTARPPLDRIDYEVHLAESKQFINILLDRTQNALRLPNYPRLAKIPLPHRLQKPKQSRRSKLEMLRTPSQADTSTVTVN